jgi:hypothetical protein
MNRGGSERLELWETLREGRPLIEHDMGND